MEGFGIQVSIKTANDTLVNVRGDHAAEFDENLEHVVSAVEKIHAAEAAFKGLAPQTTQDAVALLKTTLGAEVIGEYTTPPGPPAGGFQQTHCNRCKQTPVCPTCNQLCNVVPLSLKGGQYFKHECPSKSRDHKTVWCNEPK